MFAFFVIKFKFTRNHNKCRSFFLYSTIYGYIFKTIDNWQILLARVEKNEKKTPIICSDKWSYPSISIAYFRTDIMQRPMNAQMFRHSNIKEELKSLHNINYSILIEAIKTMINAFVYKSATKSWKFNRRHGYQRDVHWWLFVRSRWSVFARVHARIDKLKTKQSLNGEERKESSRWLSS